MNRRSFLGAVTKELLHFLSISLRLLMPSLITKTAMEFHDNGLAAAVAVQS
jgi:hypothetical protein